MRIFKQPIGYELEQPLLNKILRVHVSTTFSAEAISGRSEVSREYYDAKTRKWLNRRNWRVRIIKKLGS